MGFQNNFAFSMQYPNLDEVIVPRYLPRVVYAESHYLLVKLLSHPFLKGTKYYVHTDFNIAV
jgi:hypothetical protein